MSSYKFYSAAIFNIVILRVAIITLVMFRMSAFSIDTGRQTTTPLVDGVVHNRLV